MEKILSVAVPAYNSQGCLEKCLSSFLSPEALPGLEVIVINDGSTDRTGEIADSFAGKWPQSFSVIHKENGGHGSGINAASQAAVGRYFRVVDADDWVLTENLAAHLEELRHTRADVVINGFHRVQAGSGKSRLVAPPQDLWGKTMSLKELMGHYPAVRNCMTIHGITYRLDAYRQAGVRLSEGVFYEDSEYITFPFQKVERVHISGTLLYQYAVGQASQSISDQNQVKRRPDCKAVLEKMALFWNQCIPLSPEAKRYVGEKTGDVLSFYYTGCLLRDKDRRAGAEAARQMQSYIQAVAPELAAFAEARRRTLWRLHRLGVTGRQFDWLLDSSVYRALRRQKK